MKYAPDASVALKWVLPEPLADKARQLRDDYQNRIHELIAPDIFPVEVANALARAERRNIIGVGQAPGLLANVMRTSPVLSPYLPLLTRALDIASRMRSGVYDCLYVVLAEHDGCELVTADDRLVRNLRPHFPFIVPLSSLP
jgi:predicted nucleic acid-binding protein